MGLFDHQHQSDSGDSVAGGPDRVLLPAADDPAFRPPADATVYVLGYLKDGATGTRP